jgi:hypothetical protein
LISSATFIFAIFSFAANNGVLLLGGKSFVSSDSGIGEKWQDGVMEKWSDEAETILGAGALE